MYKSHYQISAMMKANAKCNLIAMQRADHVILEAKKSIQRCKDVMSGAYSNYNTVVDEERIKRQAKEEAKKESKLEAKKEARKIKKELEKLQSEQKKYLEKIEEETKKQIELKVNQKFLEERDLENKLKELVINSHGDTIDKNKLIELIIGAPINIDSPDTSSIDIITDSQGDSQSQAQIIGDLQLNPNIGANDNTSSIDIITDSQGDSQSQAQIIGDLQLNPDSYEII